jgi:hypothetical protein
MSTSDSLIADFERLLNTFPETSLQQWQFAYKKVIFLMGLKILNKFPQNAFGPEPIAEAHGGGGAGGGGHGGGGPAIGGHGGGDAGPPPTNSPIKGFGPFAAGGGPTGNPIIHVAHAALDLAPPPPH